jgi:hypothetical protein
MHFLRIFSASLMLLTAGVSAQDSDIQVSESPTPLPAMTLHNPTLPDILSFVADGRQVWVRANGGLELLYVKALSCERVDLTYGDGSSSTFRGISDSVIVA